MVADTIKEVPEYSRNNNATKCGLKLETNCAIQEILRTFTFEGLVL